MGVSIKGSGLLITWKLLDVSLMPSALLIFLLLIFKGIPTCFGAFNER